MDLITNPPRFSSKSLHTFPLVSHFLRKFSLSLTVSEKKSVRWCHYFDSFICAAFFFAVLTGKCVARVSFSDWSLVTVNNATAPSLFTFVTRQRGVYALQASDRSLPTACCSPGELEKICDRYAAILHVLSLLLSKE